MGKSLELSAAVCAPSRPQPCSPGHRSPPPHPAPLHEATCLALVPPASSLLLPTCPSAQPDGHLQPFIPSKRHYSSPFHFKPFHVIPPAWSVLLHLHNSYASFKLSSIQTSSGSFPRVSRAGRGASSAVPGRLCLPPPCHISQGRACDPLPPSTPSREGLAHRK